MSFSLGLKSLAGIQAILPHYFLNFAAFFLYFSHSFSLEPRKLNILLILVLETDWDIQK